LVYIDKVVILK